MGYSTAAQQIARLTAMRVYPWESWMDDGACVGSDPDLWFPVEQDQADEAVRVCRGCPVRAQCGAYAVDNRIRYGIWGGLTESQRRRIRKGAA